MTEPNASDSVTPRPGLPRTIGALNLVFGGFLLLCGGALGYGLIPFLFAYNPFQLEPAQTKEVIVAIINDVNSRAQPSSTNPEALRQATAVKAETFATQVDFAAVNRDLPCLSRYLWVDVVSAPIMSALLVVSGIGLLLLKEWARKLALCVAGLKIVRLIALGGVLSALVMPRIGRVVDAIGGSDLGAELLVKLVEQQRAQGGLAVSLNPAEFGQALSALGHGYAIGMVCIGSIYPAIVLIVLTRQGARAACQRRSPESS
jgi:hypothetical protein